MKKALNNLTNPLSANATKRTQHFVRLAPKGLIFPPFSWSGSFLRRNALVQLSSWITRK